MRRKWGFTAAFAAIAAAALVGCASQQTGKEATSAGKEETKQAAETTKAAENTGGGKTLTVAIWDKNQEPGLTEIMKDFTQATGIKTQIQVTPW